MGEHLGPEDTRKAIKRFVLSNSQGVTAQQLTAKAIEDGWSLAVDEVRYPASSLRALGLTTVEISTGRVKPTT